ncbi:aspartate/glutamate racemase family protein [Vaginisenegalia massiliensis]|uniref:aspartate/glutamate racemase family protein n=1 Tax=Vaginisenegalia massiliensis TaxID=2058294 RepID=UPI000F52E324|nr:amino acid racemase [Vaginisenegalia massiliensis]
MRDFFVILGGMGTLATESFVHLLNQRTPAHCDQDYYNYLVVNHATIPDRTAFIKDRTLPDPRPQLIEDVQSLTPLEPNFFVMTCNTAHYFYDEIAAQTSYPILHMPRLAVEALAQRYPVEQAPNIIFLGTEGSLIAGVYRQEIESKGYRYIEPQVDLQAKVNHLIYQDVKERAFLNFELFYEVLDQAASQYQASVAILGCTELSLIEANYQGEHPCPVVDAQSELVDQVISLMEAKKDKVS